MYGQALKQEKKKEHIHSKSVTGKRCNKNKAK